MRWIALEFYAVSLLLHGNPELKKRKKKKRWTTVLSWRWSKSCDCLFFVSKGEKKTGADQIDYYPIMAAREARKTEAQLAKEKVAAPHVLKSKKYRYVSGSMVWKVYSHPCSLITMYHISFSVSLIRCLNTSISPLSLSSRSRSPCFQWHRCAAIPRAALGPRLAVSRAAGSLQQHVEEAPGWVPERKGKRAAKKLHEK